MMVKLFFWFCCLPFVAALLFHLATRGYLNPYKLICVFGKKGSGKSTLLNRWAYEYHLKGWEIYATEEMPYAHVFDPKSMGKVMFPPHSVIIIDEISLFWDSRKFKDFPQEFSDWLRLQRHYKNILIICSQSFDNVDKRLRDLSDHLYLVQNMARIWTYAKKINRHITLTDAAMDGKGESRIVDNLVFESILLWPAGSRILTYIPKWGGLFDTNKVYVALPSVKASDPVQPRKMPWSFKRWIHQIYVKIFDFLADFVERKIKPDK